MSSDFIFTKENLDNCLRELGKEFRKLNGTAMKAEITLIGGAAILANYGFRDSTYDVDAIIQASSAMKDAVNRVGDKMGLPNGWLNADFTRTSSYSPKLTTFSTYYKTFSHVLTVRTISGAYLVAMKLMAGRQYKNDISDIVGRKPWSAIDHGANHPSCGRSLWWLGKASAGLTSLTGANFGG